MLGFYNQMLSIDLNNQTSEIIPLSDELLQTTLGGKGLATHLLLEKIPPAVDPLSPENVLIFANGPVSGSNVFGSCRHGVFTKSPLTGFYAESYSGGTVSEYMARTGFDAVLIRGKAANRIWIEIGADGVKFHNADKLWGLETYAAEDQVKQWIGDHRLRTQKSGVVCIGPAGENQVAFAVIENDYWRSAGRTGVGAVMGSKNVKAIAFWGNRKKQLADPELVKALARELSQEAKENPGVHAYKTLGTPMMVDLMSKLGTFPTHYWSKGRCEHQMNINAGALHERLDVTPHACLKCFMACGRLSTVKQGRHQGLKIEGPEYETIYAFGGLCEVDSIEEIAYLNDICDRLGIDTITAGNLVGLTIEAARQGKIDYAIDYNQVDKMAALLNDMAFRKGMGAILARGIKFAAAEWGMEDQAIHVKGMEPAGYDPRVLKGMGLTFGTSPRGACHLRTTFYKPEASGMIDPDQIEGKADMLVEWEDRLIIFDTLVLCRFYRDLYQWDRLATMIRGTTGLELSTEEMREIAARISDNTRRFNLREGLTAQDDQLPSRFYSTALPETGKTITRDQMNHMLADYYHARGWDTQGVPPQN
ncbi:MAG: aldehyde ferredoxin oxidoreductase family protein [Desulfobacterales bacterium]|jgi:aldehyde:ferredoxin oxidoreductase